MFTNKVAWETLRSVDSATISATPVVLGVPLLFPCYILKIVNNSSVLVTISDGARNIDVVRAGETFVYNECKTPYREMLPEGTQLYIAGSAGTGFVYLVSQYIVSN